MRLALKAQAQSRATIEALERLAHGREQTVKHVHVDNRGGQAVIADSVQAGGQGNRKNDEQSHATAMGELASAPRCRARTRSGTECQSPAVKGKKRCTAGRIPALLGAIAMRGSTAGAQPRRWQRRDT